jgi:hypothetical protein
MPIVGGLGIHRKQISFDYLNTETGQVRRGQISPADREHLHAWLARFAGRDDVAFAVEGCTGWRYVAEELAAAGVAVHLAVPAGTALPAAASGTPRPVRPTAGTCGCYWPRAAAGALDPACAAYPRRAEIGQKEFPDCFKRGGTVVRHRERGCTISGGLPGKGGR